jgi:Nucleotidyl transferase AbiEii toxin, Type IV TA system
MPRDGGSASEYDDAMTEQLLGVAADVLRSFGSAFGGKHLAIVGGAVPSLLVPIPPRGVDPHVGTADLDFHLALHLMDGETAAYYAAIIDGLRDLGLRPDHKDDREIKWRWVGQYRNIALQVEFLCPVRKTAGRPEDPAQGTPAEANIGPRGEITALAVGYGYLVPDDTEMVERRVEASGGSLSFEFPVAGITSWLCLKADAIMRRDKPKDSYDVVWLINAFGPDEAARRVAESPLLAGEYTDDVRVQLTRLVGDQFRDADSIGPRAYADFLGADPGASERRQAVGTFAAFDDALALRGIALR